MRIVLLSAVVLTTVAGCSSRIGDSRAQTLMRLDGPQHYAERRVAKQLADGCPGYKYDSKLAQDMSNARSKAGALASTQQSGAIDLEADIKRRSLAAAYGGDFYGLDACAVLDGETTKQSPLSVLVVKKG